MSTIKGKLENYEEKKGRNKSRKEMPAGEVDMQVRFIIIVGRITEKQTGQVLSSKEGEIEKHEEEKGKKKLK